MREKDERGDPWTGGWDEEGAGRRALLACAAQKDQMRRSWADSSVSCMAGTEGRRTGHGHGDRNLGFWELPADEYSVGKRATFSCVGSVFSVQSPEQWLSSHFIGTFSVDFFLHSTRMNEHILCKSALTCSP